MSSSDLVQKSEIFNKPDADITFKSSDGVLHNKNLATHSGGFPPADTQSVGAEIIDLTKDSETLELLFQFVYPDDNDVPDVSDISLIILMKLVSAAEKYAHISDPMKGNLKSITRHTIDHSGYTKVMDEVVPILAVSESLESSLSLFPAERQLSWALYREQWAVVQRSASSRLSMHKAYCSNECKSSSDDLGLDTRMLHLNDFKLDYTSSCYGLDDGWKKQVSKQVDAIRKFSSFFDRY
ncbi:hypothetical protein BDQ17DRAFT_1435361 [Cyathus striatus]|nr:hypothetical protein BDQ17DRAFT_1435361 [Cyathus striatus]